MKYIFLRTFLAVLRGNENKRVTIRSPEDVSIHRVFIKYRWVLVRTFLFVVSTLVCYSKFAKEFSENNIAFNISCCLLALLSSVNLTHRSKVYSHSSTHQLNLSGFFFFRSFRNQSRLLVFSSRWSLALSFSLNSIWAK